MMRAVFVKILIISSLLFGCTPKPQITEPQSTPRSTATPSPLPTNNPIVKTKVYTPTGTFTHTPTNTITSTMQVPTQTRTAIPKSESIPTADYSGLGDIWSVYKNTSYGFTFEYPKVYDTEAYSDCRITWLDHIDYYKFFLDFGHRSEFAVTTNDSLDLSQYVDRWVNGMELTSMNERKINGASAISIEYRFGGLNRYGTTTFFSQGDYFFIFNFTAGGYCDLKSIGLDEYTAYNHSVDSFTFFSLHP